MNREEVLKSATDWFKGDDLRANVWVDKYCLKNNEGEYLEATPEDMFKRLAGEFWRIEQKYPKPMMYEEIYELLKDFKYVIPGGSILYGVGNNYSYSSLGNCFVIGDSTDSYGSILKIDEEQVQLMKRRGGVGHDLSHLRAKGSKVSNAANTSTGAASFMHRYSNSTREVGQDGRRGALMLTMNVSHPDIEDFITAKDDLTKITGANISIKIDDAFMNAVKNNEDYQLEFYSDIDIPNATWKTFGRSVNARELWNKIIHQAWKNAEPGVLFWDTIINNSPADEYPEFKSISTNPCGEIPLCAYDTCRLMSINLFSFVEAPFTSQARFDYQLFAKVVKKAQRLMDDVIDLEEEKIMRIINKIRSENDEPWNLVEFKLWEKIYYKLIQGRRTGLSAIGLADCFAALNLKYGSRQSIAVANLIYEFFNRNAYVSSYQMAEERGQFPAQINNMHDRINDNGEVIKPKPRRNIALLTIPPSGSLSILAGISSGIEPVFNLSYTRRRKVEVSDNVKFVDKNGDKWEEYEVFHPGYLQALKVNQAPVGTTVVTPYHKATSHDIDPLDRVDLQATIQRWIDHSISSTINLPNSATEEEISRIYMYAWEKGCKGVTIYRDGCRDGVLLTKGAAKMNKFTQHDAPKRPTDLDGEIKHTKVKGQSYCVLIGLLEGKPYELFAFNNGTSNKYEDGKYIIHKKCSGSYTLLAKDSLQEIGGITELLTPDQAAITRLVSTALRHGTDIKFIIEQLDKTFGDLTDFSKAISRVLKKYITNGSHLKGSSCETCGSKLVVENGCEICKSCGFTKCG